MLEFLTQISLDADPLVKGFQPSTVYVVISILIPVTIGFVTAILSRLFEKPAAEE